MLSAASAAMAEELEATRHGKWRKNHREQAEVAAASSESPRPPETPDSKPESPAPVAPKTQTSTAVAAGKGRKWKKQEEAAASQLVEEAVRKEEKKKRKRSKRDDAAAAPSPSAAGQILEVAAQSATTNKKRRRGEVEQGQSGQPPMPFDVHPQGEEAAVDGGVSGRKSVKKSSGKPRVEEATAGAKGSFPQWSIPIPLIRTPNIPRLLVRSLTSSAANLSAGKVAMLRHFLKPLNLQLGCLLKIIYRLCLLSSLQIRFLKPLNVQPGRLLEMTCHLCLLSSLQMRPVSVMGRVSGGAAAASPEC